MVSVQPLLWCHQWSISPLLWVTLSTAEQLFCCYCFTVAIFVPLLPDRTRHLRVLLCSTSLKTFQSLLLFSWPDCKILCHFLGLHSFINILAELHSVFPDLVLCLYIYCFHSYIKWLISFKIFPFQSVAFSLHQYYKSYDFNVKSCYYIIKYEFLLCWK